MNAIVEKIIEEMQLCYPRVWGNMTATARAKSIAKQFTRELPRAILSKKKIAQATAQATAAATKVKTERSRKYHQTMFDHVMKAHAYYGDILSETAVQMFGDKGHEMLSSGAWEPSDEDQESCFREALYMYRPRADSRWYDKITAYWKKDNLS